MAMLLVILSCYFKLYAVSKGSFFFFFVPVSSLFDNQLQNLSLSLSDLTSMLTFRPNRFALD
jgi:hypothetical protein